MGKYASQSALALRLVSAKGKLVTFTRSGSVVDPVTQTSVGADTTYQANAVGIQMSPREARRQFGEAVNISIARLTVYVAMKNVSETLRGGDRFTWGGKLYAFMLDPELLDPAGEGLPIIATGFAEAA